MGSSSEVGASEVTLKSYKCSIKEITVSTKWESPGSEISEQAVAKVFDSTKPERTKTIYLISSPQGEKVKIKTVREAGECPRESHRKYRMRWNEYSYESQDKPSKVQVIPLTMPWKPFIIKNISKSQETAIKQDEELNIKCFKIGGAQEALNYLSLPIPLNINTSTTRLYASCKEGAFNYNIVSYPDIKFKLEIEIGTDEAKKKRGGHSHFETKSFKLKRVLTHAKNTIDESLGTELVFCPPSVSFLTTYNGGKSELEFKMDCDINNEILRFRYNHDNNEVSFGTQELQNIPRVIKKLTDLCVLLKTICNVKFLKDFLAFDTQNLKYRAYKPYTFKVNPLSIDITFEGQYHTSKDLLKIGRLFDICVACDPLLSLSFTIDLFYMILTALSAGTATGIYLMLKNLDTVLKRILGKDYKKKHEVSSPVKGDIKLNLVITGKINGDVHFFVDTTEEKNTISRSSKIEGVINFDLEACIKATLDLVIIQVEGEASATASVGIKLSVGFENRILQGDGLAALFEIIFPGMIIKYTLTGKATLYKTRSVGKTGEQILLDERTLFTDRKVFFEEKGQGDNERRAGAGGGSGGGPRGGGSGGGPRGGGSGGGPR